MIYAQIQTKYWYSFWKFQFWSIMPHYQNSNTLHSGILLGISIICIPYCFCIKSTYICGQTIIRKSNYVLALVQTSFNQLVDKLNLIRNIKLFCTPYLGETNNVGHGPFTTTSRKNVFSPVSGTGTKWSVLKPKHSSGWY